MTIKALLACLIPDVPHRLVVASRLENETVNEVILRGKPGDQDTDKHISRSAAGHLFAASSQEGHGDGVRVVSLLIQASL